jgi:hypothetical protein
MHGTPLEDVTRTSVAGVSLATRFWTLAKQHILFFYMVTADLFNALRLSAVLFPAMDHVLPRD